VDDMDCIEGFVTQPKSFTAVLRPRGQLVREVILKAGDAHGIDRAEMLNQARVSG